MKGRSIDCEPKSASDKELNFVDSESYITDHDTSVHESDYKSDEEILLSGNGYRLWEWGPL